MSNGILDWRNIPLSLVIESDYSINRFQIRGAPAWLETQRYDISARAPEGMHTEKTFLPMVQQLLEERFGMVATMETADFPILKLELARSGSKMTKSPEDSTGCGMATFGHFDCLKHGATMPMLAKMLQAMSGRQVPVQDATGLAGIFQFNLIWAPDDSKEDADPRPSLDSALRDLGLRLDRSTGPMPVLIIKKIERDPTDN